MTAYGAILGARIRMLLQYRAAALAGMATQVFWGIIRVMVFTAFYASLRPGVEAPMTLRQTVTYIWLGQALLGLLPMRIDGEGAGMIRSGTVAYELTRPWDVYWAWCMRAASLRIAPTMLRCLPIVVFAVALLPASMRLGPPASPAAAGLFALSVLLAVALTSVITALLTITMLWTISGEGLMLLLSGLAWVLSGIVIPLPLLPDAARHVIEWLPFAGTLDLPFRIYIGQVGPGEAAGVLLRQVGWTLALVMLGRWMLASGLRRLVVQGG
ncbi:MAG: ABC-2 family transporter protein [Phycisphaeraceae bacterium]|nr:ABC-2 family transporter protein [Phycisphaeraceae bacterium]